MLSYLRNYQLYYPVMANYSEMHTHVRLALSLVKFRSLITEYVSKSIYSLFKNRITRRSQGLRLDWSIELFLKLKERRERPFSTSVPRIFTRMWRSFSTLSLELELECRGTRHYFDLPSRRLTLCSLGLDSGDYLWGETASCAAIEL